MAYIGSPAAATLAQVADDSVTSAKIAAGAVGSSDLASNLDLTGSLTVDGTTLVVDDTNNRVGIGTASPAARLQINATTGVSGDDLLRLISGPDGAELVVDTAANTVRMLTGAGDAFVFGTAGTERLRILSSGGITFNGDTAAANALDDYEEGTWTPMPTFGGNNAGMTFSVLTGSYTKIGRLVYISARFTFTNKGSSTGSFSCYGLPFIVSNAGQGFYSGAIIPFADYLANGSTWSVYQMPTLDTNNTYIIFRYSTGTSYNNHSNGDINNNTDMIVSAVYQTN